MTLDDLIRLICCLCIYLINSLCYKFSLYGYYLNCNEASIQLLCYNNTLIAKQVRKITSV